MKNLLLISIITMACIVSCKKEKIENKPIEITKPKIKQLQEQNAIIFYFGGTWCGPCGYRGKPIKEGIVDTLGNRVSLISCQISDEMASTEGQLFMDSIFKIPVLPFFVVGGNGDAFQQDAMPKLSYTSVYDKVTNTMNKSPNCSVNANISLDMNKVIVNCESKFYNNSEQESSYYLAYYLLENDLNYKQKQDRSKTKKHFHSHVLRQVLSKSLTGDLMFSSPVKNGEIINKKMEFEIDEKWNNENMELAIVVWKKKLNNTWVVENGQTIKIKK